MGKVDYLKSIAIVCVRKVTKIIDNMYYVAGFAVAVLAITIVYTLSKEQTTPIEYFLCLYGIVGLTVGYELYCPTPNIQSRSRKAETLAYRHSKLTMPESCERCGRKLTTDTVCTSHNMVDTICDVCFKAEDLCQR
jgi:xanthosine utilization system XapX-like protein